MADSSAPAGSTNLEGAVRNRYARAARHHEAALCCPTDYRADYLDVIPEEIRARDYGCGDPTPHVRSGETVVDLGSGAGKTCFILSQIVGAQGRVIGVDCNPEMLALSRYHQADVAGRLGYANVEFRCAMIQDLRLDLDALASELACEPVADLLGWMRLREREAALRTSRPMIPDESVDCVVSNCVLNLVRSEDRVQLLAEVFRILKPGGRAAISDIVADADVPNELQSDHELWSGCISGAFREDRFLTAFEEAGFQGVQFTKRQAVPWRTVQGVNFRSVTVVAYKAANGCCKHDRHGCC